MARTWRRRASHQRHTNKPGMLPKRISFKSKWAEALKNMGFKAMDTPESIKAEKKFHNRKSRYYLNHDRVDEGMEDYLDNQ